MTKEKQPSLIIEEQEMKLRLERAEKTPFLIKNLENADFPFTSFEVVGETKVSYTVEIRSLNEKINSCSCPDYKVNTLGSCKHIEATLSFIKKEGEGKFKTESNRTDVFLHPNAREVCVRWPEKEEDLQNIRELLAPYTTANQRQLIDPIMGVASIENALTGIPPALASKIRVSQHLIDWTKEQLHIQDRENDRKQFLADVEAGKRSLQMLSCNLFPYQEQGMLHLAFQGRAILADEMGLGKTIQAIAACELLRRLNRAQKVLVVTPASLKGEWQEQIARFTGLPTLIVSGSRAERLKSYQKDSFFYLVNYEQVRNDYEEIQELLKPDILILDEAQRVKNWPTKTAWAVKQVKTPYAFVLTGTPIENRIDEIYSIMQVVDSRILGPLFKFQQDYYKFDDKGKPIGYKNLDELHRKLRTVLLRRRKKDVEEQLPERTINNYLVSMAPEQTVRYEEYSNQVAMLLQVLKKRPLNPEESKKLQRLLACMRMVADTPYILDEECRVCPKLEELEEILTGLMEDQDSKVIIFSEWERMLFLVRELAEKKGINYAWHSGSVSQEKRREDIKRFKEDSHCRLFLTTDSGSTGLNLQVANVVINLDLPWNPAKLEQRIARAWRKNQSRVVQVINLVTENTIEHRMLSTLAMKQAVADAVLDALGNSEQPLPSASRQEFIDNLELLTNLDSPYKITSKAQEFPEQIKQDLLARHSDRIHLLEVHKGKVFAVVDKADSLIKQSLSTVAQGATEMLDFDSYMTMRRLADDGMIQFMACEKQVLYQSRAIQTDQRDLQQQKLEQATTLFKEAERKLKMVSLLKSGGFSSEALPTAQEVFHKGMEVLKVLEHAPKATTLQLKEQLNNIENPDAFIDTLSSWLEEISNLITQYAIGINASP